MALVGAVFVDLFRVVADVFLLAGLVMLRLLVMFFPAAAVVGVLAPLSSIVRRMANIAGAAVVNVVAFSAGSVVHTAAVSAVLNQAKGAGMSIMSLVMCLVLTLAAFVLMYPLLSFSRMLGNPARRRRGVRRLARQALGYAVTREAVDDGTRRAAARLEDDTPDAETPRTSRRGSGAPRSESFTRPQPVWDVTSDSGGRPSMPLDPFPEIDGPPAGSKRADRAEPRVPAGGGGMGEPMPEPNRRAWVPSRDVITGEVAPGARGTQSGREPVSPPRVQRRDPPRRGRLRHLRPGHRTDRHPRPHRRDPAAGGVMKIGPTDWWRWPLWSWRNLAATVLGVALLLAGLGRAQAWMGHSPDGAAPVTATSSAGVAISSPSPMTPAPTTPAPEPSAASSPPDTPPTPAEVALAFTRAWARPYDDPHAWRHTLTAYTTSRFAAQLAETDPSRVPATQVATNVTVTSQTTTTAEVRVTTDAGSVLVELTTTDGRWEVDNILPEDAAGAGLPSHGG